MNDEPWDLFDALLGLSMEWREVCSHYQDHRDSLLGALLAPGSLRPSAYRDALAEALSYAVAIDQLQKCIDEVDAELAKAEEERVTARYKAAKLSTGGSPQGDG